MKLPELKSLIERAAVIKVSNSLNALLWLTIPVTSFSFVGAIIAAWLTSNMQLVYALLAIGALPLVASLAAYFLFLFRDPDRLQSEEFVLKQRQIELFQKGQDAPIIISEDESVSKSEAQRIGRKRATE